jgi:two-component system chemotaxis response regulator CheY
VELGEEGRSSWERPIWVISTDAWDSARLTEWISAESPLYHGHRLAVRGFPSVGDTPELRHHTEAPAMVVVSENANGWPVGELRRRLHESIPVLAIGALGSALGGPEAFAQGAAAWLGRPLERESLLGAVADLVAKKRWRVLVADLSADLRLLVKRELERRGFEVDDVEHGKTVLSRLEQEHYDLALIDLHLRDVSALELLRAIRRSERSRSLPVFLTSVEDRDQPTREQLDAWGATRFVAKYRGLDGVIEAVARFLEEERSV